MASLVFDESTYSHFRQFTEILTKYDDSPGIIYQSLNDRGDEIKPIRYFDLMDDTETQLFYTNTLVRRNKKLYYTNAALNEFGTDNEGIHRRKGRFIERIRGQVVDIDAFLPWETLESLIQEFSPTMAVASSTSHKKFKAHLYFLYNDEAQIRSSDYRLIHLALAYKVNDFLGHRAAERSNFSLTHAYRMPGLYHQKVEGMAFLTQLIATSDNYFRQEDLVTAEEMASAEERYKEERNEREHRISNYANPDLVTADGERNLLISQYFAPDTGRNNALYTFVHDRLFRDKKLTKHEALGAALYENHVSHNPPLEETEVVSIVDSAFRKWTEAHPEEKIAQMERMGSKTVYEMIIADQKKTKKEHRKKRDEDPNWDGKGKGEAYDYSDRVRFTSLVSDTSILARMGQRYSDTIICNDGVGVLVYNKEKGLWEDGEHRVPGLCMEVIAELVKDPTIYNYFYTDSGKFSTVKFNSFFKECYSVGKLQKLTEGVHFLDELNFEVDHLDTELELINCKNGVIDLNTGKLLPHSSQYLMTKSLNAEFEYLPNLEKDITGWESANLWSKTIIQIMSGDVEMAQFLQRLLGYTLLGGNDKQILAFFFGDGANGKSLIMETLGEVFGSYYASLKAEFLMADKNASSPGKLDAFARLRGCRLVTSSELEENQYWAEATIKDITGNDKIAAKFMNKGMFEFRPQATFIVRGNNRPKVTGTDRGIWRRFLTVGFEEDFESNGKKDDRLFHALREPEIMNSILGWLVRGALEYKRIGLKEPVKVSLLKASYQAEMNPVSEFLRECFTPTLTFSEGCTLDQILSVYASWARENAQGYIPKEDFHAKLKRYNVNKNLIGRENGRTVRRYGVKIVEAWEEASEKRKVVSISEALKARK